MSIIDQDEIRIIWRSGSALSAVVRGAPEPGCHRVPRLWLLAANYSDEQRRDLGVSETRVPLRAWHPDSGLRVHPALVEECVWHPDGTLNSAASLVSEPGCQGATRVPPCQ